MKNRMVFVSVFCVLVALSVYCIYRCAEINRLYPNPRLVGDQNGSLTVDGMAISSKEYLILSESDFLQMWPSAEEALYASECERKIAIVNLHLVNTLQTENTFFLYNFYLENRNWSNGADMNLTILLGGKTSITLQAGEEYDGVLVYVASKDSFFTADWEGFENENFHLTLLEHYPALYVLNLTENDGQAKPICNSYIA